MAKLNDTQTLLLSAAAQRPALNIHPLPDSHARMGARVTKALAGLLSAGLAEERETDIADQVARESGDLRFGLYVTIAGLAAIGVEPEPAPPTLNEADQPADTPAGVPAPRATKSALVLGLLERKAGATLPELIAATGWLPHTTRAALTGLRKKGHPVARTTRDGATCYRIAR
jgi:hypothetical protein